MMCKQKGSKHKAFISSRPKRLKSRYTWFLSDIGAKKQGIAGLMRHWFLGIWAHLRLVLCIICVPSKPYGYESSLPFQHSIWQQDGSIPVFIRNTILLYIFLGSDYHFREPRKAEHRCPLSLPSHRPSLAIKSHKLLACHLFFCHTSLIQPLSSIV